MKPGTINRRHFLTAMAGGAVAVAGVAPALALAPLPVRDARITRLIGEASKLPAVAQRIASISKALIGSPYRGETLIGGPRRAERFVVRDDVFDCVTFCEAVMAAALSHEPSQFQPWLRVIRYRGGDVTWHERNHYFADWCASNVANRLCKPLLLPGSATVDKRLYSTPGLRARRVSMMALSREALMDNRMLLSSGDIIGFLSQRPGLDYFHSGFVIVADDGALTLRHAAKSRGRVLDQ
ncbi:MAG: N-acetylmuramoyl-L-alanine amidase-like domain-containing protein, partial [Pseudolabrys sp.]